MRKIELYLLGRKRSWWRADARLDAPSYVGTFTLLSPATRTLLSRTGPARVRLPWTAVGDPRSDTSYRMIAFFDHEPREGETIARRVRYHSMADYYADYGRAFNVCCGASGDFWNSTFRVSGWMLRHGLVDDARYIVRVREAT